MEKNMTVSIVQGDNRAIITINHTDGTSVRKTVSIQEFKNAMDAASSDIPKGNLLGPLPEGYLESRYSSPGNFCVWTALPAKLRTILYYGKAYHVPFPPLLFFFEAEKANVTKSSLYAFHGQAAQGAALYHYPFGNVYHNGRICWGNIKLPRIMKLKEVECLIEAFFSSDTNDDLFHNVHHKTQRELLHSLDKTFPISDLQEMGKRLSFQEESWR